MSVYAKLMQARTKFNATKLQKTGHNKFAGYFYFELGDFLPTAQAIFAEVGLCGVVSYAADLATLTITDMENPAQSITITSPMGSAALKGCHEVQNIGAVETYQRRYLWVTALEIVEHDALDAVTGSEKGEPERKPNTATQLNHDAFHALPVDMQTWVADLASDVSKLFNKEGAEQALAHINEQLAGAEDPNELKMALWSQLPSNVRSALKKGK